MNEEELFPIFINPIMQIIKKPVYKSEGQISETENSSTDGISA